jgi:hypothetical protein
MKALVIALLLSACAPLFGQADPEAPRGANVIALAPKELEGLEPAEVLSLYEGKALLRNHESKATLRLSAFNTEASSIRKEVSQLNPNYLVELIALIPKADVATQLSKLAKILSDIEGYVGIPYWSVREQKTYDLFDRVSVLSAKAMPGGEYREAEQHMKPFEDYKASYQYKIESESLIFHSTNLSHLSYKGIRAVSPGGMKWYLYVFKSGDHLVYYGLGAVKAFDMFGLIRDRLEVSFLGRVGAFFNHMYGRFKE